MRDTGLERKNHEASAKHQNNIQRSLRDLHKSHERERREQQQAKDEADRLNGMFDGKPKSSTTTTARPTQPPAPVMNTAAQRKAHAEQLAALGVELPEELKKEVTGVGNYHVVSERKVEGGDSISGNRSLADILADAKRHDQESTQHVKTEDTAATATGVQKRKAEDDDDISDEEALRKRKTWGSSLKSYPGHKDSGDVANLESLLSGVKKKESIVKAEKSDDNDVVKKEGDEDSKLLDAIPNIDTSAEDAVKREDQASAVHVVFKKRKAKK